MTDTRTRVALNGKTIDLAQLAAEVGSNLTASDTEVVVADADSTVTASVLKAALDAHVPPPTVDPVALFAAAVNVADTTLVTDPAAKAAIEALKSALTGTVAPGVEPRRSA